MGEGKSISITSKEMADRYKELNKTNHIFLFIWMPGCAHCSNMKPEWEKLKNKNDLAHKNVIIADVEAASSKLLPSNHGDISEGYPTIKLIKIGGVEQMLYDGGRTAEDMAEFITKSLAQSGGTRKLAIKSKHKKSKHKKSKHKKSKHKKSKKYGRRVRWAKYNSVRIISARKS